LRNRKRELPELIQRERMKDFASRLSVARSRFGAFDSELIKAQDEARTLGSEAETKIPLLEAEIERLRSQWAFAQSETESLQYAVRQAREELTRIQDERESLLLSEPV
jgi:chromosome segregation ATPase